MLHPKFDYKVCATEEDMHIKAPYPKRMGFPFTSRCNLKCMMCGSQHSPSTKKEDMPLPVFDAIIEKIVSKGFIEEIEINSVGENILHPMAASYLSELKKYDLRILLQTNGVLLNNQKLIKVFLSGRGELRFSIDSVEKEVYEYIHTKAKWEKLLHNLKLCKEMHDEMQSNVVLQMSFIAMRKNFDHIPRLLEFCKKYGITLLYVNKLSQSPDGSLVPKDDFLTKKQEEELYDSIIPQITKEFEAEGVRVFSEYQRLKKIEKAEDRKEDTFWACRYPWHSIDIKMNGDIIPCCMAYNHAIGNIVKANSFDEIWHGERYKALRSSMLSGGSILGQCYNELCYGKMPEDFMHQVVSQAHVERTQKIIANWREGLPMPAMRMENIAAIDAAARSVVKLEGSYVEIGVSHGGSLLYLLKVLDDIGVLQKERITAIDNEFDEKMSLNNVAGLVKTVFGNAPVNIVKDDSENAAKRFVDRVKYLMLDGSHNYGGVKKDLEMWTPFVVDNGLIVMHDFETYGEAYPRRKDQTIKAIREFFDARQMPIMNWHGMAVVRWKKK